MKKFILILLLVLMMFNGANLQANIFKFTVTDLGSLGGITRATGINDRGQVVGWSRISGGYDHGFLFENGIVKDLGNLGGNYSYAESINNSGQIVGRSMNSNGRYHSFLYDNKVMNDLGDMSAWDNVANDINDQGQIAGSYEYALGRYYGYLWQDGTKTDLGTMGYTISYAEAINDNGQIVGVLKNPGPSAQHAFFWKNGVMSELGTLGGSSSIAEDINNNGMVVGRSLTVSDGWHAFMWDGTMHDLGAFFPQAINDAGLIVGNMGDQVVFWQNSMQYDLNTMIDSNSGWTLKYASDINSLGQLSDMAI